MEANIFIFYFHKQYMDSFKLSDGLFIILILIVLNKFIWSKEKK